MLPAPLASLSFDITGTVTLGDKYNPASFQKVVFQGCSMASATHFSSLGKPRMMRAHVIPADPQTVAQLSQRDKMRQAVQIWQGFDLDTKTVWTGIGKKNKLPGYNAFLSSWIKTH